eukprot:gnl/MRDRNA2_/MRDRNA2_198386_c0_seq1.p1 gnl/MRDRNA2_/MRDRNA2_198386_c0~~gnl/MRDRNA2_/MRDRNA2_198386_c0_seq1.p1  ORF type:complete len:125 (+),score=27.62 gnl/MRDRNA2_/MRDRNA2_198386_c0_seq1:74-448(+)
MGKKGSGKKVPQSGSSLSKVPQWPFIHALLLANVAVFSCTVKTMLSYSSSLMQHEEICAKEVAVVQPCRHCLQACMKEHDSEGCTLLWQCTMQCMSGPACNDGNAPSDSISAAKDGEELDSMYS